MSGLYVLGGVLVGAATVAISAGQDGRWSLAIAIGLAVIVDAGIADRFRDGNRSSAL